MTSIKLNDTAEKLYSYSVSGSGIDNDVYSSDTCIEIYPTTDDEEV